MYLDEGKVAVKALLAAMGEDTDREGLHDTPRRVAEMYQELTAGYAIEPKALVEKAIFKEGSNEKALIKYENYDDYLCFWRCLAYHIKQPKDTRNIKKEVKLLFSDYCGDERSIENYSGVEYVAYDKEYTDEFYGALGYLTDLSKKHKKDADKQKYDKAIQEKRQNLYQRTVKNYDYNINSPHVELDLPVELREPIKPAIYNYSDPIHLKYNVDKDVPHGCLRGGQKPTFRNWQSQTRKKNPEEYDNLSHTFESNIKPLNNGKINELNHWLVLASKEFCQ